MLWALHMSTSQFAPFLPTAIIMFFPYTFSSEFSFILCTIIPLASLFSIIKSFTSVSNIKSILCSSKYFSNFLYSSCAFSVPRCLIGISINVISSFLAFFFISFISFLYFVPSSFGSAPKSKYI